MLRSLMAVFVALVFLGIPVALAHGGDEGGADAPTLVSRAVGYLKAEPPRTGLAKDALDEALTAEGEVNRRFVELAISALDAGAVEEAASLAERALGETPSASGPVVRVDLGPAVYEAFVVAVLLVGFGAYGLGRKTAAHGR